MARPLRIEFPGALYHVTSRGNAREAIFHGDPDRRAFLDVLADVIEVCDWSCHAYCLMTNHYHIVVETPRANLSRGMQRLNGVYTQRFNRRHARVGHVLQGRFKAVLVERESHMLELTRYVVLNPVRAGMVTTAEEYRWSSLRATLGLTPVPAWLTLDAVRSGFGSSQRYLEFVREGVGARSPWDELTGGVLGSDGFVKRVTSRARERARDREFPRRERLAHREPLDQLLSPRVVADRDLRDARIREAHRTWGYSLAQIGRHVGLHYTRVSRLAARVPQGQEARPDPTQRAIQMSPPLGFERSKSTQRPSGDQTE
jgi:REP element-mobilizing transposase RayT